MSIRLAIHPKKGSFTDRWTSLCHDRGLECRLVNCFDSGIVGQVSDCDALLWHPAHYVAEDMLLARQLIQALECRGLLVYPSTPTFWHFDDKVAQKYLLEAIGAPLVPTHTFFSLEDALAWIEGARFPLVFKLRRGAGSRNVRLVPDADTARRLVRRAFGRGFKPIAGYLRDSAVNVRRHRRAGDVLGVLRRLPRSVYRIHRTNRLMPRERGYVLFQDFVPDNAFDTRITVIGKRAFGFTRNVRPGDFRASGSGDIVYDDRRIKMECVSSAFTAAARIGAQSIAFDFVIYPSGEPRMVEISFGFAAKPVFDCAGHWDQDLNWHEGHCWPQDAILDDVLVQVSQRGGARALTACGGKKGTASGDEPGTPEQAPPVGP